MYIAILFSSVFLSCTNKICLHRIKTFLNASTAAARERYLSGDFRSFFLEKKGDGKNKTAALQSFLNWDAPLHPDVKISSHKADGHTWTVEFIEQNDFSKLMGFPGWKGKEVIRFNSKKKIDEMLYVPDESNPNYKNWLQPAVDWLNQNRPNDLAEVYKNEKLVQTPATARKWIELLQAWRQQSRQ